MDFLANWWLLILAGVAVVIIFVSEIIQRMKRRKERWIKLEEECTGLKTKVAKYKAEEMKQREYNAKLVRKIEELIAGREELRREIERRERAVAEQKEMLNREVGLIAEERVEMERIAKQREESVKRTVEEERTKLDEIMKQRESEILRIVEESKKGNPWLAEAFADYFEFQDLRIAEHLSSKLHPALRAADQVREIARARHEAEKKWRRACYLFRYWQDLLPHLFDFEGETIDDMIATTLNLPEEEEIEEGVDPAVYWQGDAVKENLTHKQRLQNALDNWRRYRKKSNWQIGKDYERYVAW